MSDMVKLLETYISYATFNENKFQVNHTLLIKYNEWNLEKNFSNILKKIN